MNINDKIYEYDSKTIQEAIKRACKNKENKVVIPRINPRTGQPLWEITETIYLPSDFCLILDNCHLRMADGVFCNMFCNENAYTEKCEEQKNISITGIGNAQSKMILKGYVEHNAAAGKFVQASGIIFY